MTDNMAQKIADRAWYLRHYDMARGSTKWRPVIRAWLELALAWAKKHGKHDLEYRLAGYIADFPA